MHIQHIEIPTVLYAWYLLFITNNKTTIIQNLQTQIQDLSTESNELQQSYEILVTNGPYINSKLLDDLDTEVNDKNYWQNMALQQLDEVNHKDIQIEELKCSLSNLEAANEDLIQQNQDFLHEMQIWKSQYEMELQKTITLTQQIDGHLNTIENWKYQYEIVLQNYY